MSKILHDGRRIFGRNVVVTYDHVGTNPTVTSEWPALTCDMEGSNPLTMTEWKQPLYLIKWEHIPQSH